jgi:hypothetical protein
MSGSINPDEKEAALRNGIKEGMVGFKRIAYLTAERTAPHR